MILILHWTSAQLSTTSYIRYMYVIANYRLITQLMPTMGSSTIMCPTNLGTQKRWVVIGFPTPCSPVMHVQASSTMQCCFIATVIY